jgi:uncharacterized membrane protein YuzA (DUF378 family)
MKTLDIVIAVLPVVGGVNSGMVGLFDVDLDASLFRDMSALSRFVYAVVGIAAICQVAGGKSMQSRWSTAKV